MELDGKAAIVTGAARGLGAAIVERLLTKGVKVCFCDVNDEGGLEKCRQLAERFGDGNVMYKHCDVCKDDDIRELIEATKSKFQRLDMLINNAAVLDEVNWEKMIDVNLGGYVRTCKLAIEYLRTDNGGNGGVILNVASIAGCIPTMATSLYSASKHGIIGYSCSIALLPEVKGNGIRVVCLCPGCIDAPIFHQYCDQVRGWRRQVADDIRNNIGLLSTDTVLAGVIKLLQDKDNNGKQLYVDNKHGMGYRTVDEPWTRDFVKLQESITDSS